MEKSHNYETAEILVRDLYDKGHGEDTTIERISIVLRIPRSDAETYFDAIMKERYAEYLQTR